MIKRRMLTAAVAAVLICALAQHALATRQEKDMIVLEGARYFTYDLPSLGECLPGVKIPKFRALTTANWKGYRSTWAVINGQLFLIGVEGKTKETKQKRMLSTPELFPNVTFPFKVTAFSGRIELKGRTLDYVIKGNTITHTDKLVLEFKNGRMVDLSKTTHDRSLDRPAKVRQPTQSKETNMKITLTSIFVDDPIKAHKFYTEILGFSSKQYDPDAQLAVVVSPENPDGTALLLEPRGDSFAKDYQEQVYKAGLPIIVFGVDDLPGEIERLKGEGVKFREDLTKKEWGLENLFEDSFGNIIMLQKNG